MPRLYVDEQFPRQVVELLRALGHDVLTVQEAGNAGLSDKDVLDFAVREDRAVLTLNRRDFFRLHRLQPNHAGIVACKDDQDWERLTTNINRAILSVETLTGRLIRVYKSPPSTV